MFFFGTARFQFRFLITTRTTPIRPMPPANKSRGEGDADKLMGGMASVVSETDQSNTKASGVEDNVKSSAEMKTIISPHVARMDHTEACIHEHNEKLQADLKKLVETALETKWESSTTASSGPSPTVRSSVSRRGMLGDSPTDASKFWIGGSTRPMFSTAMVEHAKKVPVSIPA
ncbi:unnamed protein product [Prorocentrum cordatum]|uniref:Uncharacterized protein n=1 Tax=Prorocentrum cordatum TaxID=2364126 RepID=A0ABN9WHG8_9DINO|nr:unnamed protein product [Polarella glacialis]